MTTDNSTSSSDIKRLHAAIIDMDCLSRGGFSEISAIAELALAAMETPNGYINPEKIAYALQAIQCKADDIKDCVNSRAEEVGCHYIDPSAALRYAAQRTANAKVIEMASGVRHG